MQPALRKHSKSSAQKVRELPNLCELVVVYACRCIIEIKKNQNQPVSWFHTFAVQQKDVSRMLPC